MNEETLIINYEKIASETGITFESIDHMLDYLQRRVSLLATHNKNLNNQQYYAVCDIENILNGITTE